MTTRTLYVPVLIETAAQAEALPVGTLATRTGAGTDGWTDGAVRVDYGDGWQIAGYALSTDHEFMVGWTALVPVEAEEETEGVTTWPRPDDAPWPKHSELSVDSYGSYYYRDEDGVAHDITEEMTFWLAAQPVRTRLVTRWEDA